MRWIILLMVVFARPAWAQQFTPEELAQANTAANSPGLTAEEKAQYQLLNLARLDGHRFAEQYVKTYHRMHDVVYTTTRTDEKGVTSITTEHRQEPAPPAAAYVKSLISDLNKTKQLPPLKPSASLNSSAAYHAEDMGKSGMEGHNSSDGTDCFARISRYNHGGAQAENCSYGYSQALDIVMQLLIDEGQPEAGHRQNILNPVYHFMGVAIRPHKTDDYNCVQDFSDTE